MRSPVVGTPCPFRCRCVSSSPTSHHICSVGACLCYNDADHVCGCRANICRPGWAQLSHGNTHCINRPTSASTCASTSSRYAAKYSSAEATSCTGTRDTNMLEFANLNFVLRRLSLLKQKFERDRRLQALAREECNSAMEDCANNDHDGDDHDDDKSDNHRGDYDHAAMQAAAMAELEEMKLPMFDEHMRGFCTCERKHAARADSRKKEDQEEAGYRPRKYAAHGDGRASKEGQEDGDYYGTSMDVQSRREMDELWGSYNCRMHLKRLVERSRKAVACRVLESTAHVRLTTHMWAHVRSTAQAIPAGDLRTNYLRTFHCMSRKTHAGTRAGDTCAMLVLQEPATYGDMLRLLMAAQKSSEERAGEEQGHEEDEEDVDVEVEVVEKALASAEEGLLEEVRSLGFPSSSLGDIRLQMSALLSQPQSCIEIKDEELTTELVFDMIKGIAEGKLESLHLSQELVKLGCFMFLKKFNLTNTNQMISL